MNFLSSIPSYYDDILTVLIYSVYLFFPGYFIVYLFNIRKHKFLLSYAISFTLLTVIQLPFRWAEAPVSYWAWSLQLIIAPLALATIYKRFTRIGLDLDPQTTKFSYVSLGLILVIATFAIYHYIVGPYTEIPSDFWEHLARVNIALNAVGHDQFNSPISAVAQSVGHIDFVHFLHAKVAHTIKHPPLASISSSTLVPAVIFLGSIYLFTVSLLERSRLSSRLVILAATLSTLLTITSFGTATFSYVRYYAYFPTIFCFPIFFLCISLLLDFLGDKHTRLTRLYLIAIFLITMALVHAQEAMFAVIVMAGITVWRTARLYLNHTNSQMLLKRHFLLSLSTISAIIIGTVVTLVLKSPSPWGHTPHVISLTGLFSSHPALPIASPTFRFWDTLGYFGVVIYIFYVLNIKYFRDNDYINVCMFSPVFTHFNPVFSLLFLHIGSSTTLWRTSYLMPLSITASLLIVFFIDYLSNHRKPFTKVLLWSFITLILLSLTPFSIGDKYNRTSRFSSLSAVDKTAGASLWSDLIIEISRIKLVQPIRGVLTDHVTTFVLDSSVFGRIPNRNSSNYFPNHNKDYETDIKYSDFTNHLLVVNRRDGLMTSSSAVAGHWPQKILKISNLYPEDIDLFILNNPDLFRLIWANDHIYVYQIIPK